MLKCDSVCYECDVHTTYTRSLWGYTTENLAKHILFIKLTIQNTGLLCKSSIIKANLNNTEFA